MIYGSAESYPLFLVSKNGEGGTPNIQAELNGTTSYSSELAQTAIGVVLNLAKDLSPQSKVVTTLSQASIQKQADALDAAISKLLGKSMDEARLTDTDVRYMDNGLAVRIDAKIPPNENSFRIGGQEISVGSWVIGFEEPRPSIFVDWRICSGRGDYPNSNQGPDTGQGPSASGAEQFPRCQEDRERAVKAVFRDVDAATVLKTAIAPNDSGLGQLGAYLSQLDWYKATIPKLSSGGTTANSANATKNKGTPGKATTTNVANTDPTVQDVISDFCRKTNNTMTSIGLSSVDAGIVVWAIYNGMPDIPQSARKLMASNETCEQWIDPVRKVKEPNFVAPGAQQPAPVAAPAAKVTKTSARKARTPKAPAAKRASNASAKLS
jgi:hypothetical protein